MEKIDKQVILDYHEALGQLWEQYEQLNKETKNKFRDRQDYLSDSMELIANIVNGTTQEDIMLWTKILQIDENYKKQGVIKND